MEDYARYAHSVVQAEEGLFSHSRTVQLVGVQPDKATNLSVEHLISPLARELQEQWKPQGWNIQSTLGTEANKARLVQLLGEPEIPALLFTASHGLSFNLDDVRGERHVGALLCETWRRGEPITEDKYFSVDDISHNANLSGLIAFIFACYGVGIPKNDSFGFRDRNGELVNEWKQIAPRPLITHLPQKLLRQGALAVIGHIDRAWLQSFYWHLPGNHYGENLRMFKSILYALLQGKRVGYALEEINSVHASLASQLVMRSGDKWQHGRFFGNEEREFVYIWTANNDARNYAIIGDPAVRLRVEDTQPEKPVSGHL